tara:strand:+ start:594 stop:1583 length:990 start_codon:yes stop_codon:yes gene_type:complete
MKIKSIIIGLGNIGLLYDKDSFNKPDNYLTHSKALFYSKNFSLEGGIDFEKKNRDIFTKLTGKKSYSSIDSLKNQNKDIDLFVISTPTSTHLKIIMEIINYYKPKVILCEKPLSYNLIDSEKIIDICKKNQIELFVNFQRRVEESISTIKKLIDKSSYCKGSIWYSNGFINNGIHFIDLMTFFLGKAKKIEIISKENKNHITEIDFEADLKISYKKGEIYFLSWPDNLYSNYKIEILTNSERIVVDDNGSTTKINNVIKDPIYSECKCLDIEETKIKNNLNISIKLVYDDILRYINDDKTKSLLNNLDNMKEVQYIIDEIKKVNEKTSN